MKKGIPNSGKKMNGMTVKQKKFVSGMVRHGNQTRAARDAYETKKDSSAGAIGTQLMRRDDVRKELQRQLTEQGMSIKYLLEGKKRIITRGMEDVGQMPVKPEILNKTLDSMIELYMPKDGAVNKGINTLHQHIHLESKDKSELLKERNKLSQWFNDIGGK